MSDAKKPADIEAAKAHQLSALVDYAEGAIVSRTLKKTTGGTMTVFAFDQDQELSEHSAPFDAFVHVLDGQVLLTIGGTPVEAKTGDIVLMPADIPHAVQATARFKMLLVMLKDPK
jgi:quercetin dioxygenase-like cupin family protein